MPFYMFRISKGEIEISLTTSDRETVAKNLEKWICDASEYAKKQNALKCKEMINTQINEEREITQKNIDEQLRRIPKSAPETKETSLDVIYAPNTDSEEPLPSVTADIRQNEEQGFESILEKSINNPEISFQQAPSIKKDNAFLNYINGQKPQRAIDYLLLTAYYFTQYEQKPRFTLKQLNAKLMQNIAVIIDHNVMQEAINRDYIECLPDLTGLIGASEYRLTAYGEKTLLDG